MSYPWHCVPYTVLRGAFVVVTSLKRVGRTKHGGERKGGGWGVVKVPENQEDDDPAQQQHGAIQARCLH